RPQPPRGLHRLDTVRGLADHVDVRFGPQNHPEPCADQAFIVGQQDADHAGAGTSGRLARTAKPPDVPGPALNVPPYRAARSRIPRMPKPSSPGTPPRPSSSTATSTADPVTATVTRTDRARACRNTLVSAS